MGDTSPIPPAPRDAFWYRTSPIPPAPRDAFWYRTSPIPPAPRDAFCTGHLSWARNACLYVKPIGRLKSTFHRAQRGGQYPIWNRTVEKILFLYCKWPILNHSVERREYEGTFRFSQNKMIFY